MTIFYTTPPAPGQCPRADGGPESPKFEEGLAIRRKTAYIADH
jgi:hypothetical protein